ncbi:MAG: hypothetical protein Q8L54_04375 [Devosia sp.]|nr:hypothetical protein [Devosia sp.]
MSVINPSHLLEQAKNLIAPPVAGAPRRVDPRRAISAAYHGVFHAIMAAAAAQFIGATKGNTSEYGLVYRSIGHRQLKDLCSDLKKPSLPQKLTAYIPSGGFGSDIVSFASAVVELQEKRHTADYDPLVKIRSADAALAVRTAESALARFAALQADAKLAFLGLLVFKSRPD